MVNKEKLRNILEATSNAQPITNDTKRHAIDYVFYTVLAADARSPAEQRRLDGQTAKRAKARAYLNTNTSRVTDYISELVQALPRSAAG